MRVIPGGTELRCLEVISLRVKRRQGTCSCYQPHRLSFVAPGVAARLHSVIPLTPSSVHVLSCRIPCQCMPVPLWGIEFLTVIASRSPQSARCEWAFVAEKGRVSHTGMDSRSWVLSIDQKADLFLGAVWVASSVRDFQVVLQATVVSAWWSYLMRHKLYSRRLFCPYSAILHQNLLLYCSRGPSRIE